MLQRAEGSAPTGVPRLVSHSTCSSVNTKVRMVSPKILKFTQVLSLA